MHRTPPQRTLALSSLLLLAACVAPSDRDDAALGAPDAGVDDRELAELSERYWDWRLDHAPLAATWLGESAHAGKLPPSTPWSRSYQREQLHQLSADAARLNLGRLRGEDQLTAALLSFQLERAGTLARLDLDSWIVDPVRGPWSQLLAIAEVQPTGTTRERAQCVERWRSADRWLRAIGAGYQRGAERGLVSSATAVEKAVAQLDSILATDPFDSPLVALATGDGRWVTLDPEQTVARLAFEEYGDSRAQHLLRTVNRHLQRGEEQSVGTRVLLPSTDDLLAPEKRGAFLGDVLDAVREQIYPALAGLRETLVAVVRPAARADASPGLVHVPGGAQAYAELARLHTTLDLSPDEIHSFGLAEVARIEAEICAVGERVLGESDLAVIQRRLREDPELHFGTRAEIASYARAAVARAEAAAPAYFGSLPSVDCEVVAVPAHEERDSTIAYYRSPAADGSRPGRYYVNTSAPETRPRYEAAVLAYHEAVPGHHTQLALAQELGELPLFRRHSGPTAFVEGWALYTERLCDEMGLFDSDIDRLGMLSFDAWRAARLVVDTGLHAGGWSRDKAIAYLFDHTLLAANNCANEVDRYIAWPGQALAYKVGQQEFLRLRAHAEQQLGAAFDLPAFHDMLLAAGAIPLPLLAERVETWIAASAR